MKRILLALPVAALLAAGASPLHAAAPVVPGFERIADKAGAGQLLLGELNCTSCHQPAEGDAGRKQAPVLDDVAARVRVGWLRKFLADPQAVKPGTTMPHLFADDPDRAKKVESLVHFLASTGSVRQERPDLNGVQAGRNLFGQVGCVACHGPRDAAAKQEKLPHGCVPLGDLTAKYSVASLAAFLDNPHKVRPSGRMPHLVSGKEARDIASYLLQGAKVEL